MLNVLVEDLDGQVELHKTEPIWLLFAQLGAALCA